MTRVNKSSIFRFKSNKLILTGLKTGFLYFYIIFSVCFLLFPINVILVLRSDGSTCLNSFLIGLTTSHKGHVLPELPFKLSVWIRLREHVNVQTLPAIKVKHMRLSELPPAPCDWMLSVCLLYGPDVPFMKWSYGACWGHDSQRSRLLLDHAIRRSLWGAQRGRADAFVEFGI